MSKLGNGLNILNIFFSSGGELVCPVYMEISGHVKTDMTQVYYSDISGKMQ